MIIMDYKVNFDGLFELRDSIQAGANAWHTEIKGVQEKLQAIVDSTNISGAAAGSLKEYINIVHKELCIPQLNLLIANHVADCGEYVDKYWTEVDNATQHAFVDSSILRECKLSVDTSKDTAVSVDTEILRILSTIKDVFFGYSPNVAVVVARHDTVSQFIDNLDQKIQEIENIYFERGVSGFSDNAKALENFINELQNKPRTFRAEFTVDQLLSSENFVTLYTSLGNLLNEYSGKQEKIKIASENEVLRLQLLEEEREERRRNTEWIKIGVALIGSVVLIVATAGTATPLVCGVVGAATGVLTTATTHLVDNYIENGTLFEHMDWSDFAKDCVIAGVTGFVSGYAAGSATGSVIKQPLQKAFKDMGEAVIKSTAEGFINTAWETVEGVVEGKSFDEISKIAEDNMKDMFKDAIVDAGSAFVQSWAGSSLDVNPAKKGILKKISAEYIENASGTVTEHLLDFTVDVGYAMLDGDQPLSEVVKEEAQEFAEVCRKDLINDASNAVVSGVVDGLNDKYKDSKKTSTKVLKSEEIADDPAIDNVVADVKPKSTLKYEVTGKDIKKTVLNTVADTASDIGGTVLGAVSNQSAEILMGEREDLDFAEILKEDVGGYNGVIKTLAENAVDNSVGIHKFERSMQDADRDGDGMVEVVVFDKCAVLKDDYDAAREVAKKGAYKNMSTQDILGLSKNTPVHENHVTYKTVRIEDLEKSSYKRKNKETNVTRLNIKETDTK